MHAWITNIKADNNILHIVYTLILGESLQIPLVYVIRSLSVYIRDITTSYIHKILVI